MPVLINGSSKGTSVYGNELTTRPTKSYIPSVDQFNPATLDAFFNRSFEKDTLGWQGSAVGWDTTTLSRVFSVPILFDAVPSTGTNGATPSTSDAVPDTIDGIQVDGTGTLTYSTTSPIVGTVSYVAAAGGGSNRACIRKGGFSGFDRQFVRCYFNKDTTPAVNQTCIKGYQTTITGTQALSVRINTTRHLEIINAANSVVSTSASVIPIGADWHVLIDITASTGAGTLYIWLNKDSDGAAYDEALPIAAGANAFGTSINEWTFGNCATNNVTGTLKFGGIAISYVNPGLYEAGEVSGNAIAADSGKWVMKVTYPTGTNTAGALYRILAGSFPPGLKKMIKFRVYVPSGHPDVRAREYATSNLGKIITTKDAWVDVPIVITTVAGDQYVGVIDATQPSASHTAGNYFLIDNQTDRDWPGLIANPSVEETLAGWTSNYFTWDTSTITRDHTVLGHVGDWAIKTVFPAPVNGYAGLTLFMPAEEDLQVGNTYTFGIWVYVPTGQPDVCAEIPFVSAGPTVSTKDAWTLATVTGVFTSTTQAIGVRNAVAASYSAGQFFYADDASLTDLGVVPVSTGSGFLVLI